MSSTPLTAPTDASAPSPWRTVFALDLRALALYRIGLAAVLLLMMAQLWPDLAAFTTDNGILHRSARPQLNVEEAFPGLCWQLSLHMWSGELAWQQGLVALQALVAAALLVGWKTRWMALASWLLLVSLQARNPLILQGGDDVLRNMLFWSLFLPLGARFSLDARHRTLRGDAQPLPDDVAHLGTAGFILQLLCVYFFTGLLKSDPVWRTEFTALHYALHLDHLTTRFGYWLVSFPALTKLLTAGTMLLEHAGPILLLVPRLDWRVRLVLVLSFMSLHVGIALCCAIGLFPLTCIVCWVALIPTQALHALARLAARRPSLATPNAVAEAVKLPQPPITQSPPHPLLSLSKPSGVLLGSLIAYMLLINIARLDGGGVYTNVANGPLKVLGEAAQINQYWCMFAARPAPFGGWYDMRATLADGREVNLWTLDQPVQSTRPAVVSETYPSLRWRKTCMILFERHAPTHRACFGDYLVRRYQRLHPDSPAIVDARIILHAALSPDPDQPAKSPNETIVPITLWQLGHDLGDPREHLATLLDAG